MNGIGLIIVIVTLTIIGWGLRAELHDVLDSLDRRHHTTPREKHEYEHSPYVKHHAA